MVSKAKRLIFVSALAISILSAGMYGVHSVQAEDSTIQSTLVQKIAQKFSLKTEDVQAVFDQQRQERQALMEQKYEQMLTDAVTKGEITQAKKQLILAKHKEIQATKGTDIGRTAIQKKKTDLMAWAESNGVDLKYLAGGWRAGRSHMK